MRPDHHDIHDTPHPQGRPRCAAGRAARRARPTHRRRTLAVAVAALSAVGALSACSSSGGGKVTLNFYAPPDNSGAIQSAANNCSTSQYKINYIRLPNAADGQRRQLVQRLAAKDSSLDIMALDVTWEAEFAEAKWIKPWTGANKTQAESGTLKVPLQTAQWKGKLYGVPANSNTELLWYRADLTPTPPTTWDQMIDMAIKLKQEGKPHYIEIQGAQYEGVVVWFNSLVASAGGSILNSSATAPSLGAPAVKALTIMKRLATSPAADPSLSVQMEDQNRLGMEGGSAAFEINYPFVWPSMQSDNPKVKTYNGKSLKDNFKYAPYPSVDAGTPAKPSIGGQDFTIGAYTDHSAFAFKAALCLRNRKNQTTAAVKGGLPPTIASLYNASALAKPYPFHQLILNGLSHSSVRPKTPAYQNVSIVISHAVSPPGGISPKSAESTMSSQIKDALASKGLIP